MANLGCAFLLAVLLTGVLAKPQIDGRIAGGYPAREGQFPYAAAIYLNLTETNEFTFCGGSLISPSYVLTAAHCLTTCKVCYSVQEIEVVLGNTVLNATSPSEVRLRISSQNFIIPTQYQPGIHNWDIALIELPESLELNKNLQPVKLPEGTDTYAGELGVTVGWGTIYQGQVDIEQTLRFTENVILSNKQCVKYNSPYKSFLLDSHLCQSTLAGRGACHGDSGGPLVVDDELVGIGSVETYNCFREYPVIYTRITSFRNWIKEQSGI